MLRAGKYEVVLITAPDMTSYPHGQKLTRTCNDSVSAKVLQSRHLLVM